MISKKTIASIFLAFVLFVIIILYAYFFINNKNVIKIDNKQENNNTDIAYNLEAGVTKFSDVRYKIVTKKRKNFITEGKQAIISKNKPNIINLETVHSFTELKDKSILKIKSDKGLYLRDNKNIKYYQNVIITNKNRIIKSDVADYLSNNNLIKLKKVIYTDDQNLIKSDFATLNLETNDLEMVMKNQEDRVYGQRNQK